MTRGRLQPGIRALVVLPAPAESDEMAESLVRIGRSLVANGVTVSILPTGDPREDPSADLGPLAAVLDAQTGDAASVALRVEEENAATPFDVIVAAGIRVLSALSAGPDLVGKLWGLPALPDPLEFLAGGPSPMLDAITAASRWVLCPDEITRGLLDGTVTGAAQKTVVFTDDDADDAMRELVQSRSCWKDRSLLSPGWRREGARCAWSWRGSLHFLAGVMERLRVLSEVEFRVDHVVSFARHDEVASLELVAWADVVICEWCSPVAIWYSRNKRPGQRLVVRLHRMEIYNDWTDQVDINAVDQVVCVSPHYARLTRERTGWPAAKIGVIPNYVDVARFRRAKVSGAEYNLGFVGIVPMRKRVDLAFDVLERLRRRDPRFTLFVKSQMAWDLYWAWRQPEEREYTWMLYRRIGSSELLRDGVVFDRYGPDVAAWMRKIGFVLSTSEDESFHLAPAEGMSSGAVPALLNWPGSDNLRHLVDPRQPAVHR